MLISSDIAIFELIMKWSSNPWDTPISLWLFSYLYKIPNLLISTTQPHLSPMTWSFSHINVLKLTRQLSHAQFNRTQNLPILTTFAQFDPECSKMASLAI